MTIRKATALCAVILLVLPSGVLAAGLEKHDPAVREVPYDEGAFKADPYYGDRPYNADAQEAIYGAKRLNKTQRPLVEAFRDLYNWGAFREPINIFGEANPFAPQFMIFGDFRTAIAYNDNGDVDKGLWASRLNLDVDLKLTATERFHAFWDPIRNNGEATRYEFDFADGSGDFEFETEWKPDTFFFEGDLSSMLAGVMGTDRKFDLPIAGGRMPLLFANGIWVEDTFDGFAFTIPARNSRTLDITNMDWTFFFGFDNVTNQGINAKNDNNDARIYGFTGFIEALYGYTEIGYGYVEDRTGRGLDHHNIAFSHTRRFRDWVSTSGRIIANVGQDPDDGIDETADGVLFLFESSLITHLPSNLVPYLNVFYGWGNANPLARANGDGALKNTGILFQTDALSGYPRLNSSGHDAWGGALGLEWIALDFSYQVVFELATVQRHGGDAQIANAEYGAGIRFQIPLTNAWLLRTDAMYAIRSQDNDLAGVRAELRWKF
ncbi:MAG: hypothetical protein QNK05_17160 [Myxococcota bacterium]|nr:hypothetical protein [Myxococcota bacterium]